MKDATRRTIRTGFQLTLDAAIVLPLVLVQLDVHETTLGAVFVAVGAGITRVMGMPAVERFLQRWVPWLAATAPDDVGGAQSQ
jgi:hypothetical protein